MRCPTCSKFAAYGDLQAEEESSEIVDDAVVVSARAVLPCAECGEELKEFIFEFEVPIQHDCETDGSSAEQYELRGVDLEMTEEMQTHSATGKPIKQRNQKRLYGVAIRADVVCHHCAQDLEVEDSQSELASSFEELA